MEFHQVCWHKPLRKRLLKDFSNLDPIFNFLQIVVAGEIEAQLVPECDGGIDLI